MIHKHVVADNETSAPFSEDEEPNTLFKPTEALQKALLQSTKTQDALMLRDKEMGLKGFSFHRTMSNTASS
jgi:hypothetical protein